MQLPNSLQFLPQMSKPLAILMNQSFLVPECWRPQSKTLLLDQLKQLSQTTMQHSEGLIVVMILAMASYTSWLILNSMYIRLLMQSLAKRKIGKKKRMVRPISQQRRQYPNDCTPAPLTFSFKYLQSPRETPLRQKSRMVWELPLISKMRGLFRLLSISSLSSRYAALKESSISILCQNLHSKSLSYASRGYLRIREHHFFPADLRIFDIVEDWLQIGLKIRGVAIGYVEISRIVNQEEIRHSPLKAFGQQLQLILIQEVVFYKEIALLKIVTFEQIGDELISRLANFNQLEGLPSPPFSAEAKDGQEQSRCGKDCSKKTAIILLFDHSAADTYPEGSVVGQRAHLKQLAYLDIDLFRGALNEENGAI